MSHWRQTLQPASFRGVPFEAEAVDHTVEQRVVQHEIPLVDGAETEHLGRGQRTYSLTAFVLGREYVAARDALEVALDDPSPGLLKHPTHGQIRVSVTRYSVSESRDNGGMAVFSIEAVEAGATPEPYVRTQSAVLTVAADAVVEIEATWAEVCEYATLPGWAQAETLEDLATATDDLVTAIAATAQSATDGLDRAVTALGDLRDSLATLIATPAAIGAALTASFAEIEDLASLSSLSSRAGLESYTPSGDPSTDAVAANGDAYDRAAIRLALARTAEVLADTDLETWDDALRWRDLMAERLEAEAANATGDEYTALMDLRAAVVQDLSTRARDLPRVVTYAAVAVTSTLEVAQALYGDADRAGEIRDRNDLIHPGFTTGRLEVLSE